MVGVLMMDAMDGDPEDRAALERERREDGEEILDPLGGLEAAVREQAVIADADSAVDGQKPEDDGDRQAGPTEVKERGDGAEMEGGDEKGCGPVDAALAVGFPAHADLIPGRNTGRGLLVRGADRRCGRGGGSDCRIDVRQGLRDRGHPLVFLVVNPSQ